MIRLEGDVATVGPERILTAAATDALIGPLGRWVRRAALADRRRWSGHLDSTLPVPAK